MFSINLRIIPRSFFYLMPINIGAELIALVAIINKASAFYALGALFTGHPLTVVEWVVNSITFVTLPLFIAGYYAVHRRRALWSLAYTHLYILDTFMNTGFSIYFIVHWFTVGTQKADNVSTTTESAAASATAAVSQAVAANARRLLTRGAEADAKNISKSATLGQELAVTIVLTTFIIIVRLYFMLVLVGFARILVQHANLRSRNGEPIGSKRAKLQWLLLAPFERFWTGHQAYAPVAQYRVDKTQEDVSEHDF